MSESGSEDIVARYFAAWSARDFDTMHELLDDNVDFVGVRGTVSGREDAIASLKSFSQIIERIVVKHRWKDELEVLTWYELQPIGKRAVDVANWMHVENGKIAQIRVLFNPDAL